MGIERTFQDIPEGKLEDVDQQVFLAELGWSRGSGWQDLLSSKRVLIISEAGAGKTYECRTQCQRLWDVGEPAFFLELATLASSDLRTMLSHEEEVRLDAWLTSQSDVATFFLDSIDELKLSRGKFDLALNRLSKSVAGQLGRVRVVITTRPVPFDEELVRRFLPVPAPPETEANGDTFARVAMGNRANKLANEKGYETVDWRIVALMPLSDRQIEEFARDQGVGDPKALVEDLRRRNAQEFARRPQDLIELCADWRDFKRIRTHKEQVATNIYVKLKPREERAEAAELSVDRAIEGASRLALAMMLTRRLTIRHSAESDVGGEIVALDPAVVLPDWSANERKALLERPLFGIASYGRVRFHHRSVAEYLTAERIKFLRDRGMTASALRRLIFAQTRGKTIVRPSKRPIAGWLALADTMIFETLRDHEPAVLLVEGDPETLTPSQRNQALRAYVERFGQGGWRGLDVPHIQIHRFASPELAEEMKRLWGQGVENPEIRKMLLQLIDTGGIAECSDIANAVAIDTEASRTERIFAIDALAALGDSRLDLIISEIANDARNWPDDLSRGVVLRLFPEHLRVTSLCLLLARIKESKRSLGDLGWHLPRLIAEADFDAPTLELLRDGLYELASSGLRWRGEWPHIVSDRPHLANALAATCVSGLKNRATAGWLRASALSLRLPHRESGNEEAISQLKALVKGLPADHNEQLFWAEDALIQSVRIIDDPWDRFAETTIQGAVEINSDRDGNWIKTALADSDRPAADRAMLLQAALRLAPSWEEWRSHTIGLKVLVGDLPELIAVIDDRLKSSLRTKKRMRWEVEAEKRKNQEERREAKNHASWVTFWREVAERPEIAFSPERSGNTAWNLWRAMSNAGDESRASGWNRRFIEAYFGKVTADRLRLTLMGQWRNDRPTLVSERPDDEKNTYLERWQLGLAAIYAEAEDPQWATKLTDEEAKLAARFAVIELNELPKWLKGLVMEHPTAVDSVLGQELSHDLQSNAPAQWHSMLLQSIGNTSEAVAGVFVPRLVAWLNASGSRVRKKDNENGAAQRLGRVVGILMKHGNSAIRANLCTVAKQQLGKRIPSPRAHIWLHALIRLDASAGVNALEAKIGIVAPAPRSKAVAWIGDVFGDRHDGVNLADPQFTPSILLRLLRLSYRHVRPQDDVRHEDSYTPDARDHAEHARNAIVNVLLRANGEDGWAAKLEMAADPLCEHFKDRILAVAEEYWAEELDAVTSNDAQVIALDKSGEAPPSTNEAMFSVMVDRLDDLDDLLLRDVSPREAWAGIAEEKVTRREIARELGNRSNGLYTVDQEAATADEKETDIRLRSTVSSHEAVIELKLADGRTAEDLRDALKSQLVTKYMAADTSRSGCLMVTLAKDRRWKHPDNGSSICFSELVALLREEADRIVEKLGGTLQLHVYALDLRPRLPTEAKSRTRARDGRK